MSTLSVNDVKKKYEAKIMKIPGVVGIGRLRPGTGGQPERLTARIQLTGDGCVGGRSDDGDPCSGPLH